MATITSQSGAYLGASAQDNIREDLGNVIFNVSPFKTPFFSGIAKAKATNDNHEWLSDSLRDAVNSNAVIEANGQPTHTQNSRTRLGNYIQIAEENAIVTLKAELLDKAGVPGKEMAYQLMKKGKELQMDVETQMLDNQLKVAPTTSAAGVSASVSSWVTQVVGANTTAPTGDGTDATTLGADTAFSETTLQGLIDTVWDSSGDLDNHCIMGDATMVGKVRSATGIATDVNMPAAEGTIYARVTIYQSQFGPIKVVPNKHMFGNALYVLDMSSWAIAFAGGKAIHTTDIATQTSAEQKLLEMYYTLESRSDTSNGTYHNIAT